MGDVVCVCGRECRTNEACSRELCCLIGYKAEMNCTGRIFRTAVMGIYLHALPVSDNASASVCAREKELVRTSSQVFLEIIFQTSAIFCSFYMNPTKAY